jgi:uncharacterized membrane protein YdbT with pleckstrin-like domain/CRP-like cAMP-binding protein
MIDAGALNRLLVQYPDVRKQLLPFDLFNRLRTHPLTGALEGVALGFLADATRRMKVTAGQQVYAAGIEQENIYLIDQGQVRLDYGTENMVMLGNGATFGLLEPGGGGRHSRATRTISHSATATITGELMAINREIFVEVTGLNPDVIAELQREARAELIEGLPVFRNFTPAQKRLLLGYVSHYYIPFNHLVMQQGEVADSLWVLMPASRAFLHALDPSGNALLSTTALGPSYFSETALRGQVAQDSTVEADAGSQWLRLHWRDFEQFSKSQEQDLRPLLEARIKLTPAMESEEQRKRYPWLQPGEFVVTLRRRHWMGFLNKSLPTLILAGIFVVFLTIAAIVPGQQAWTVWLAGILIVLILLTQAWSVLDYWDDWLVVTNRRVIVQERVLFVSELRKEAVLEQVQNVDWESTLFGRWFNYGTIVVQTAGATGKLMFTFCSEFNRLRSTIFEQRNQRRRHASAETKMTIQRMLEGRLGLTLILPSRVFADLALRPGDARPVSNNWLRRTLDPHLTKRIGNRLVWRKHWLILVPQVVGLVLALLLALFGMIGPFFAGIITSDNQILQAGVLVQALSAAAALALLLRLAWVVEDWRNDTYEVSDSEVVNVDKAPLGLSEARRSAGLGRIQNVELEIPSPIHLIFNFGNVRLQTAAESGDFQFVAVADPRGVAEEIQSRIERFRRREEEDAARRRSQELPDWFEMYNRLEAGKEPSAPGNRPAGEGQPLTNRS